jgi:hypothetical protein
MAAERDRRTFQVAAVVRVKAALTDEVMGG